MSKIFKPKRLSQRILLLLLATSVSYLVACNNPGGGGREISPPINTDTIKNHAISITEADQFTANFRAAIDDLDKKVPHFKDSMDFGHAEGFPADVFRELLRQTDSSGPVYGIRVYYGRDANGKIRQILVPYDSAGNDIVRHYVEVNNQPKSGVRVEALKVNEGQALQNGTRCPTACGDSLSGLN